MLSFKSVKKRSFIVKLLGLIENKKTSDRVILRSLFFLFIISGVASLLVLNQHYLIDSPVSGGELVEGIIGTPRFVNPILATSKADLDMSALIYSGLMKISPTGELVPNLANSVTVSDDGTTYNIVLHQNIVFHDGTQLTAKDVAFTIALLQDANLKSPLRGNWIDIKVEEINDYELNIILEEAYAPFIENLTIGILPKHIWSQIPIEQIPFSEKNTNPIGTGPFAIKSIIRNKAGMIETYNLDRFESAPELAKIFSVKANFYNSEEELVKAYQAKQFTSSAYLPSYITQELNNSSPTANVIELLLPRVFTIFMNQNHNPALRDQGARQALSMVIDREEIITRALFGYGIPTIYPLPITPTTIQFASSTDTLATTSNLMLANKVLAEANWRKNDNGLWEKRLAGEIATLQVTLRSINTPFFETITQLIANNWRQLGVEVQVELFEQTDLLQSVIRPRDYESLLFGIEMSRSTDLYPFWHSSQREDPGLNIANYANIEVDSLLTQARTSPDQAIRQQAFDQAVEIIVNEYPAIFLFAPTTTYVTPKSAYLTNITNINRPSERFMNISQWYLNTQIVWPVFK